MPKFGACCLSSINLSEYVVSPFTKEAFFDLNSFVNDIPIYVRNADKIIDESAKLHGLKEQQEFALNYRNIGIGIMGLGTLFLKLGIRFGSQDSIKLTEMIASNLFRHAVIASSKLAAVLGSFPKYTDKVFDSTIVKNHFTSEEIIELRKNGLRNSSLLSIAPTGSIGTMLGISTGAEAYFSDSYYRKTVSLNGDRDKYYKVELPIFKQARESTINKDAIVIVHNIPWKERIEIQSTLQRSIDTAISSTCNLSKDTKVEEIELIYLYAWQQGLKGFTIYVDGCRDGVLSTKIENSNSKLWFNHITPVSRKTLGTTHGTTSCKKCACGTLYVTCNRDQQGNLVEVFTHTSKGGICQANMNAVTRLISLNLRSGVKIDEIIDQIKGINCPACTTCKAKGIKVDGISCPDIISKTISEALKYNPCIDIPIEKCNEKQLEPNTKDINSSHKCPECGEPLIASAGCYSCMSCGYSKCSM